MGIMFTELDRLEEAEASLRQAIALKSDFAEAHSHLGITLQELGRLEEAEASFKQAIALEPDYANAHYNLGVTLKELGRLDEAEVSYTQAIALKPDFVEAYSNLGNTLTELDRLEEAETSCRQAIALKPDFADAHSNLGIILYGNGDTDAALISVERATVIDQNSIFYSLFLSVLQARKVHKNSEVSVGNINNSDYNVKLPRKILMLNKLVEEELLAYLYKRESLDLKKENDPSFGNARGSKYTLFQDDHPVIKTLEEDLTKIMVEAVKSEIYILDSFFSIFGAGGGTSRHNHLNSIDKVSILSLAKQKYSLVYYLLVGDQECSEPGILRLYEPSEDILPDDGLITIFPADRYHSSVYGGNKDRVIVGVNFYSL
jgi:tetratricopeptide (TPR) repeat protein